VYTKCSSSAEHENVTKDVTKETAESSAENDY
jgi:hypothetical protein